jgi:predicted secreted protein
MNWLTGIVVYILVWWVTLFAPVAGAKIGADDNPGRDRLARHLYRRQRALVQLSRFVT